MHINNVMAKNSIYDKYYLHVTSVLIRIYSKMVELQLKVVMMSIREVTLTLLRVIIPNNKSRMNS